MRAFVHWLWNSQGTDGEAFAKSMFIVFFVIFYVFMIYPLYLIFSNLGIFIWLAIPMLPAVLVYLSKREDE